MDRPDYGRRAAILKAMAHPSRLRMIDALSQGERCVCELQKLVGADVSTVSKHLSLMKAAGLVLDRRQGLQVFYRLRTPCILRFFDCVEAVIAEGAAKAGPRPAREARARRARPSKEAR